MHKIAVIGSGSVGRAIAGSLQRAGHEVVLSAGDPGHAQEAAQALGVGAAASNAEAVAGADTVMLAVPFAAAAQAVADEIAPYVAGKLVIDAMNPLATDSLALSTESGTSGAEQLQAQLPDARVVKAFNTLFASTQAAPSRDVDGYLAGDDPEAVAQVTALLDSMGFTPLAVGGLQMARHLESMALLNIALNATNGWSFSSTWKLER